jgi:hypothetical protein
MSQGIPKGIAAGYSLAEGKRRAGGLDGKIRGEAPRPYRRGFSER